MPTPASPSRVIVVDCGIAHAAGSEEAIHPTSRRCRDFLKSMRQVGHRLGWSSAVAEEWHRHRSAFASKWWVSMHARKKVVAVSAKEDSRLRDVLTKSSSKKTAREAMLKDAHLLEAAIAAEMRIASLDDTVRRLFAVAAQQHKAIQRIVWVNPDGDFDSVVTWLEAGAVSEKSRWLVAYRPDDEV